MSLDEMTRIAIIEPRWGINETQKNSIILALLIFLYICFLPQTITIQSPMTEEADLPIRFRNLKAIVTEVSKEVGFNPALAAAIIMTESEFKVRAISPKGAIGLMQMLPSTARLFGVKNPFDPRENIRAGLLYLRALWQQFGSLELALAAYNAGPGAVMKYGDVPPFKETKNYVPKVQKYFRQYKKIF